MNLTAIILLMSIALASCVPTSVLVNTKDVKLNNAKVKRSSNNSPPQSSLTQSLNHKSDEVEPNNNINGGKSEMSLGPNENVGIIETKSAPQKRGVNSQLMYGDIFNSVPQGPVQNNGIWGDEVDPSVLYPDEFDEYQRGTYHPKAYDNLQSILNAEMYPEPIALPLHYPYRYYGDRKKRSNQKSYDMRLKRESKLTPADMLALVALVEAGERSRQDAENEEQLNEYQKLYMPPPYNTPTDEDIDLSKILLGNGNIYGLPYNLDTIPQYDVRKPQPLGARYIPNKRYMVAKKKRSLPVYGPAAFSSINYDNRFGDQGGFAKNLKRSPKTF